MEITFNNVCYKNKFTNVSVEIKNDKINGIYNYNTFLKLIINPKLINAGSIYIDDKQYKNFDYINIAIIDKEKEFYTSKVIDEILFYAKLRNYKSKNIKKEILEWLKEFNLEEDILKRIGHSLSETEKYFIKIIANLITKPQIVVFKDIMDGIDYNNKKIIKRLINKLKEDGTLVILTSMNSNILYELTDEVFIFDKGKLLVNGPTNDIYTNVELLIKNKIDVPYFSLLTYKANKEKKANLFYRKDVRDVIKDVYKSVS
jgi:ABC-2 type transport system ATP-binding protein